MYILTAFQMYILTADKISVIFGQVQHSAGEKKRRNSRCEKKKSTWSGCGILPIFPSCKYHNLGFRYKIPVPMSRVGTKYEPNSGGNYTSFYRSYVGYWYKILV
jgi:hypothetical protein